MLSGGAGELLGEDGQVQRPVFGALACLCCARGIGLYREESKDVASAAFAAALPGVPLSGMFAAGEMGPAAFNEHACSDYTASTMHTFTSVFSIVKLSPSAPVEG